MPRHSWIVEPALLCIEHTVADLRAIRRYNPQRFEMEQLTAVVHEDTGRRVCAGYKDLSDRDFWVRGHIPKLPAMPMPLMCEAASQLVNYYILKHELCLPPGCLVGLRQVRCHRLVLPGDRLFIAVELLKVRLARVVSRFQCIVGQELVCEGILIGGVLQTARSQWKTCAAK
jgi:3-hydroxyacyl-[acyl-carrier-protein] dehydratase